MQNSSLNRLALTASLHCLAGCAMGEVLGMAIGTALGWGNLATTVTGVLLAFVFGYGLTSVPLFRTGMPTRRVVGTALGSDTASIVTMEAVDNAFILAVPGALEAGLADGLFWGSILGGFVLALPVAFFVNRALIRRGKGHALVHEAHADR